MPRSLEQFFEDILSESGSDTTATRRHARAALLAAVPENSDSPAVADIAAHLDAAPDSGGDATCIAKMALDAEALYELESAESYLDRVIGEDQPVPATLLRLAGVAPAGQQSARLPQQGFRSALRGRKPLLLWGGAIAAVILAGVTGYAVHDVVHRNDARTASTVPPHSDSGGRQGFAPGKNAVVPLQAPPSGGSTSAAPPTYTTANAPVPTTRHAVGADDYPLESVQSQEQGTVKVKYLVLKDGTVGDCQVEISSGFPRLDDAACVLVKHWLFKPATVIDGSPIEYWLDASVVFQLK